MCSRARRIVWLFLAILYVFPCRNYVISEWGLNGNQWLACHMSGEVEVELTTRNKFLSYQMYSVGKFFLIRKNMVMSPSMYYISRNKTASE